MRGVTKTVLRVKSITINEEKQKELNQQSKTSNLRSQKKNKVNTKTEEKKK